MMCQYLAKEFFAFEEMILEATPIGFETQKDYVQDQKDVKDYKDAY